MHPQSTSGAITTAPGPLPPPHLPPFPAHRPWTEMLTEPYPYPLLPSLALLHWRPTWRALPSRGGSSPGKPVASAWSTPTLPSPLILLFPLPLHPLPFPRFHLLRHLTQQRVPDNFLKTVIVLLPPHRPPHPNGLYWHPKTINPRRRRANGEKEKEWKLQRATLQ